MKHALVLASSSPRRQDLLRLVGLDFIVVPSDVNEEDFPMESPASGVEQLALMKARDVAFRSEIGAALVIGADTVVVVDGAILGKPIDEEDAFTKLSKLSGRSHEVITGVAVVDTAGKSEQVFHERTEVTFRNLSPEEIRRYIATGEPMDKAGAYGIQGLGAVNIISIKGDYFNVVGLPVARLCQVLAAYGITPW